MNNGKDVKISRHRYLLFSGFFAVLAFTGIGLIGIKGEELDEHINITNVSIEFSNKDTADFQDHHYMHGPIMVNITLYLEKVDTVEDPNQDEFFVEFVYFADWMNKQDSYWQRRDSETEAEYETLGNASEIWIPNIYFIHKDTGNKRAYYGPSSHVQIRSYRNGTVIYHRRIGTQLKCTTDFRCFPFDVIKCKIELSVDEHSSVNQTILKWAKIQPLRLSEDFIQPLLLSLEEQNSVLGQSLPNALSMSLYFTRRYSFYLWKYYLPVLIILLLSWIPFWLRRVLILRIYISMSTVIFLGWYYITRPNELQLPYLTALDAWRSINFVFVVLAALESIFITYMIKTNSPKMKRTHPDENEKFKMLACNNCPLKKRYLEVTDEKTDLDLEILKLKANFKVRFVNVAKEVEIIDSVAKLFFPLAYCIFLFFYSFKSYINVTHISGMQ